MPTVRVISPDPKYEQHANAPTARHPPLTISQILQQSSHDTVSVAQSISNAASLPVVTISEMNRKNIRNKLYKLGGVSLIAGLAAGTLGIGGGFIVNPIMILMGYSPLQAMAMSSLAVFFASSISVTEFLLLQVVSIFDVLSFIILAIFGSLQGVYAIRGTVRYLKRESVLMFVIMCLMGMGLVLVPVNALLSISFDQH